MKDLLQAAGHNAEAVTADAQSEATLAEYAAKTESAIENGFFGAPTYVIGEELFWGQDRLEWVEALLNE